MFEIALAGGICFVMSKIASQDDQSVGLWVGITIFLCILCIALIPLPFIRLGLAFLLSFLSMMGFKLYQMRSR